MATLSEIIKTIVLHPLDFSSDSYLAYERLNEMKDVGKRLVHLYGSGAGSGIDDYYHSLLHCELGQKKHRKISEVLGDLKEAYDYNKKVYINGQDELEVLADASKDLTNNKNGYMMGEKNPEGNCRVLLDGLRTRRMRDANIR